MSAFETKPETQEQSQADAGDKQTSFVDQLASARGDKWRDPEVVAKGKLEADQHIENLTRQIAEMREDLSKKLNADEFIAKLDQRQAVDTSSTKGQSTAPEATDDGNTSQSEVDVESLVEKALATREAKNRAEANIQAVDTALTERYGTEAGAVLQAKSKELGFSLEELKDIASRSPNAFLKLVGDAEVQQKPNSAPSSSVNSQAVAQQNGKKDWSYFQNLRRTNPSAYYSARVQNEMASLQAAGKL